MSRSPCLRGLRVGTDLPYFDPASGPDSTRDGSVTREPRGSVYSEYPRSSPSRRGVASGLGADARSRVAVAVRATDLLRRANGEVRGARKVSVPSMGAACVQPKREPDVSIAVRAIDLLRCAKGEVGGARKTSVPSMGAGCLEPERKPDVSIAVRATDLLTCANGEVRRGAENFRGRHARSLRRAGPGPMYRSARDRPLDVREGRGRRERETSVASMGAGCVQPERKPDVSIAVRAIDLLTCANGEVRRGAENFRGWHARSLRRAGAQVRCIAVRATDLLMCAKGEGGGARETSVARGRSEACD